MSVWARQRGRPPKQRKTPNAECATAATQLPRSCLRPYPRADASANSTMIVRSDDPSLRTVFKVKYVAEGVAYLEGGARAGPDRRHEAGGRETTNLPARQGDSADAADPRVVAELESERGRRNLRGDRHSHAKASGEGRRPGLSFQRRCRSAGAAASAERDAAIPRGDFVHRRRHAGRRSARGSPAPAAAFGEPRARPHRVRLHRTPSATALPA